MLRSLKDIMGYHIAASDGELGSVRDFYFDDQEWVIRYLVADTGRWLPGRQVLLSPVSVAGLEWASRRMKIALTKDQIEKSPAINEDEPVSRQAERDLVAHFDWPTYWGAAPHGPATASPHRSGDTSQAVAERRVTQQSTDPCLRSVDEVTGYHIQAKDGEIGHVEDFITEDDLWALRYMVVDTRNWLPGRKVLVAPAWIDAVHWDEAKVLVNLTRDEIKNSPPFDPAQPINREYETRLYDFYGRPKYWM